MVREFLYLVSFMAHAMTDHLQPECIHRRDSVRLHGNFPGSVPSMRGLVCDVTSTLKLYQLIVSIYLCSFQRTNQTDVLNTDDLPSVVSGMRQICALQSSLLGDVRSANGELSATETAAPAATSNAALGSDVLPSFWNMFPAVVVLTIVGFSSLAVL